MYLIIDRFHIIQNIRDIFFLCQLLQCFIVTITGSVQTYIDLPPASLIDKTVYEDGMHQYFSSANCNAAGGMIIKPFVLLCSTKYLFHCHQFRHRPEGPGITFISAFQTHTAKLSVNTDSFPLSNRDSPMWTYF